jgi:hypothetical protein
MVDLPRRQDFRTATCVIFNPGHQFRQTVLMAHFPQPHNRVRAPRVRIPSNEPVKINIGKKQVSATLHRLSLTGGLVQFDAKVGELSLAEVVLTTPSGSVTAMVEFLKQPPQESSSVRAFRFVALDDPDFNRLVATLQSMRKQGWAENSR